MPKIYQKSHKNHLKLAPGDSWGRSCGHCSPQVPPGQKKRRKMQKLGAPRGTHRGLKIVIFGLKFKQNAKKVAPRTYLSKTIDLSSILARFWLLFDSLGDHKNSEKCVTLCKLRDLTC